MTGNDDSQRLESYKNALASYLSRMREIHDGYARGSSVLVRGARRGDYHGIPSWTHEEQCWRDKERAQLEALARRLNLTPGQIEEIHSEVVGNLESDGEHP